MKRYILINTDWSDCLKLFEHDINNDYLWRMLLLLLIMKRYILINTDWSDCLILFDHDINNDYLWRMLLLLLIILIIAENHKKPKKFVILQTDHINTKVCLEHDNIALQYLFF